MNAPDILRFGHQTVLETIKDLEPEDWQAVGATSEWTPKDVMAHLASYELVLEELLHAFIQPGTPTPLLNEQNGQSETFNESHVVKRREQPVEQVTAEYTQAAERVLALAKKISPETWRQVGTIPWYGAEYSLDDFIVYRYYAHKREHSSMIKLSRTLHKKWQR